MKENIVISGISIFSAGPLTIYYDLLENLIQTGLSEKFHIVCFVHKKKDFKKFEKKIQFIELHLAKKSYLHRLYYEYIYFYKYSLENEISIWFSLHDISPRVQAKKRYVYCHNPIPFLDFAIKDFRYGFVLWIWKMGYGLFYKINIKKNDAVIVQQEWIRKKFEKKYTKGLVVVARPNISNESRDNLEKEKMVNFTFIYPSMPRIFKNFEVICEASKILEKDNIKHKVLLTISGKENRYAQDIVKKYRRIKSIQFIGLQERKRLLELYEATNCLIFPSRLETWGLPIEEYKVTGNPIILADLQYAHETIGTYEQAAFFKYNSAKELSVIMKKAIQSEAVFSNVKKEKIRAPYFETWEGLLQWMTAE